MDARQFHGPKDYLDAARDPAATPAELRELARSPYDFVWIAVAQHPSAPGDLLEELGSRGMSTENGTAMLLALAKHPNASTRLLEEIAESIPVLLHVRDLPSAFEVGVALSTRPDTPHEALAGLLTDSRATTEFRKVIARETTRHDVVELLRVDRSERVRRAIGRRPDTES